MNEQVAVRSNVSLDRALTNQQIDNLYVLAKVWGFLKYHHPEVATIICTCPAIKAFWLAIFCSAGIFALHRILHAPFGYAFRGARDSAIRADAIGLNVERLRWFAFTIAGAAAGLAGGLYAFSKGSIDPTLLAHLRSPWLTSPA